MSGEFDFSSQGVVFTKADAPQLGDGLLQRRIAAAIRAEQEIREPRVSESLRARFVG